MKLGAWISNEKMTRAQFAALVEAHPVSVSKWITNRMLPRRAQLEKIAQITAGAVTANDFMQSSAGDAT